MVTRLLILALLLAPSVAIARDWWQFPASNSLPDNGRFLLYDPSQPLNDPDRQSRHITGLILKQLFLNRGNHTGTQPISSVSNLQMTLDNKIDSGDPRLYDARNPLAHAQGIETVTGLQPALDGKVDNSDPRLSDARTPLAHTQAIGTITDLQAVLDGKQPSLDPAAISVDGVNHRVGFGTTSPSYLQDVRLNGLGLSGNGTDGIGINLENATPATLAVKAQDAPKFRFSGRYWDGAESKPMYLTMAFGDNGAGTNGQMTWFLKRGDSPETPILSIDAAGQWGTPLRFAKYNAQGGINEGLRLSNDAPASASSRQNTPIAWFFSHGWASGSGASRPMSLGMVNSPETGVTNPVGVHAVFFGTDAAVPVRANELLRYEWGDRLGVVFNNNDLPGYSVTVKGPVTATSFNGTIDGGTF